MSAWFYQSPVGLLLIRQLRNGDYGLFFEDELCGQYDDPWAAADDVYSKVTGCSDWDLSAVPYVDIPTDLGEWTQTR